MLAKIHPEIGESCRPHQPLFRVVDVSQCYLVANLEAATVRVLAVAKEVALELQTGRTPTRCTGKVQFISPVVDSASGLQEVKIVFDNAAGSVYPGIPGALILPEP